MALSKDQSISLYGTESYTAWGETEAAADAKAKGLTAPTSADQLSPYLDSYQNQSYQQITVPELNIPTADELKSQLTPTTPKPEVLSRTTLLDQQKTALGVTELESELNTLKTEERTLLANLRELTGAEEGKPVALNVMAGRITEEQRQAQTKLDYLNVRKATLVDELTTKYNAINTYINYAGMDYQDAVNAYENEFAQNVQVQNLLSGFRQEAWKYATDAITINETMKQNSIDNARANLTTVTNAILSGNMSYGNLSPDEKLNIQKLEIQSGMPVGTISKMQISAKDKILGFSSDNSQAMIMNADGSIGLISTGIAPKSTGTGAASGMTAAQKSALDKDIASRMTLEQLLKKYNNLSPNLVYAEYNELSPYGPSKAGIDQGIYEKYNITSATSNTSTTKLTATDINNAKQIAIREGLSDADIKRIDTDPDYALWLLANE